MFYYLLDQPLNARCERAPDVPNSTSFLQLFKPCGVAEWAIFECDYLEDSESLLVPRSLSILIDSTKDYPPALALAKRDSERFPVSDRVLFCDFVAERLRHYLDKPNMYPYRFRQAISDLGIGISVGSYYWVLDSDENFARWVSRDYMIYTCPADYFGL